MLALAAFKGATWLVLSRFVGRIIDFFNLLILARMLVPADFGHAALAMALVLIIDMIFEVPVTQALVRLPVIEKSHLDTGFTLGILRSGFVVALILACAWPYASFNSDSALVPLICVLAIAPLAKGLASPAMVHLTRKMEFRPSFLLETASKIGGFAVAITVVLSGGGYWALIINFTTSSVLTAILSYVAAPYRPGLSLKHFPDFASFMGWFTCSQIVSALNWQYDKLMIGMLSGDKALLGRFSVANDVALIPTQSLIGPALQSIMAAFSQIGSDTERLKRAFLKVTKFAMLISVPVCLGISLTSDLVINVLLGEKWKEAAPYLSLLSLSILPNCYFQTLYSLSLAVNRMETVFRLNLIDLCIRLVVVTAGFYLFSVDGAIYGRLLLSLTMFCLYMVQARSLLDLSVKQQMMNLWKILVAGAAMAIVVTWFRWEVAPQTSYDIIDLAMVASVGAAVYLASLFALGLRIEFGASRFALLDRG
jgi:PST family polysaccharide transporter